MAKKTRVKQAEVVEAFSERLRELRRSRGMTQAELAKAARVTGSYVWKLEAGVSAPGIDLVERLASALGTSLSDLLPESRNAETMKVLRERAEKLSKTLVEEADRETLLMLNPLLARLLEAPNRRR